MTGRITGAAMVAGVVGNPIGHSMSPVLHNGWITAARLDAVFVPFCPPADSFKRFVDGLRGGGLRGLNVTIPFKEEALACADSASELAKMAGAANLLLFRPDGSIYADNTDGPGLIGALRAQGGFEPGDGPAVILGAGGAARGAAAALVLAGSPQVRIVNRTRARAEALVAGLSGRGEAYEDGAKALEGAAVVINATSLGLGGGPGPECPLEKAPGAVVMDMVYKPLRTEFLQRAQAGGHRTVDGLEMLIRQAVPSFEAFFETTPPGTVDARALAIAMLEARK